MKRKMSREDYRRLGLTAKKQGNYWEIFLNHQLAMTGLSDSDLELLKQKSREEIINILSMR